MHESRSLYIREEYRRLGDPEIGPLMLLAQSADDQLTNAQIYQFFYRTIPNIMAWEEQFQQSHEGMIERRFYLATETVMKINLTMPGWRASFFM